MPITAERLYALLTEHERAHAIARELRDNVLNIINDGVYTPEMKLEDIRGLVIRLVDVMPDKFMCLERMRWNANARRNERAKEKMRRRRRAQGVPERLPPSAPHEIQHEHELNAFSPEEAEKELAALYARQASASAAEEPFKPQFEEVKSAEQIEADNAQLLDGL